MGSTKKLVSTFVIGLIIGGLSVFVITKSSGDKYNDVVRLKEVTQKVAEQEKVNYTNSQFSYSFNYPAGLIFKEFNNSDGSQTVVFQKPGERVGFQVYVTPYEGATITGERILYDVQSGVVEDLKEEYIKRENGEDLLVASFKSTAPFTGDNSEIWFLEGGKLYEFTSYRESEELIREVLKTITFE